NTGKAISYFEQSIKGAYNKPAALKLSKLKKGSKISDFVKPRVKIPEYFNQFKYQLPAQCLTVDGAAVAEAEKEAFYKMIDVQAKVYGHKIEVLGQAFLQSLPKSRVLRKDEFMA